MRSTFARLLLILFLISTAACGSVKDLLGKKKTAAAPVSPISSTLAGQFKGLNYPSSFSVAAAACASYSAELYRLTLSGAREATPVATTSVAADGTFTFTNLTQLNLNSSDLSTLKSFIIEISGCGSTYRRPLTGVQAQNISAATDTLALAYYLFMPNGVTLNSVNVERLKNMESKLEALSDDNRYDAFVALKSDNYVRTEFLNAFGFSIDELGFVESKVTTPALAASVNEGGTLALNITRTHWNNDYVPEIQWLLGAQVIGTSEDLSFIPGKNLQGTYTLRLRIGKRLAPGVMDVQRPIYEKDWNVTVNDTYPATAPALTLTSAALTNSQNVLMAINTGLSQVNCETFSDLIITEDAILPPASWAGSFTCATQISQNTNYLLGLGDGAKTLALWVRDSAGNVSVSPTTVSMTLDQTVPSVSLNNLTGGQVIPGNGFYSISYTASDLNFGTSPISLEYSSDGGLNYLSIVSNVNNSGTRSWSVPNTNSATFRVRVTAVDRAGNSNTATSASNFSVSTVAPVLTQTSAATATVTNAALASVTYGGVCDNAYPITVDLDGSALPDLTCTSGLWNYTTSAMNTDGTRVYTFSQSNGIVTSVSATLKRDTVRPSISAISIAGGVANLNLRFTDLTFSASDGAGAVQSDITHICGKTYQNGTTASSAPATIEDGCWIDLLSGGIPTATALTGVTLSNFLFNAYVTDNHTTRAWVRDRAGNISTVYAEDSILFTVPEAIKLSNVTAVNSDSAPYPPSRASLPVVLNDYVYLKWKTSAGSVAINNSSVRIFYNSSTSELSSSWIELDSSTTKLNAANASCSVDGTTFTGCYRWQNTVGASSLRFRIQLSDVTGGTVSAETNRINTGNYNVLVGDLGVGIGGVASQFAFPSDGNQGKRVTVTDDGIVYALALGVGLVRIKPTTSQVELLIPETTSTTDGAIGTATLKQDGGGGWIGNDQQGRIYFYNNWGAEWQGSRVRRFNPANNTVETVIAGSSLGTTKAHGTPGTQFKPGTSNNQRGLTIAPNGDLYFADLVTNSSYTNLTLWRYNATTGLVESLPEPDWSSVNGYHATTGAFQTGVDFLALANHNSVSWSFNPDSTVKEFFAYAAAIAGGNNGWWATFNSNYQAVNQASSRNLGTFKTGYLPQANGKVYATNSSSTLYVTSETNFAAAPAVVLNSGGGSLAADGTAANISNQNSPSSYTITSSGRVYFVDKGLLRFIDESGLIRTYMGTPITGLDDVIATNMKISGAIGIYKSNAGFIFGDYSDRIFEYSFTDSKARVRAGTGQTTRFDLTKNARETGIAARWGGGTIFSTLAYDPNTDSIYSRGVHFTTNRNQIIKISSSGVITQVVGGLVQNTASAYPVIANGSLGTDFTTSGPLDGLNMDVGPVVFNPTENKLLLSFMNSNHTPDRTRHSMMKHYHPSDGRVYDYAGLFSGAAAPYTIGLNTRTFSPDATIVSNSQVPDQYVYTDRQQSPQYDDANLPANGGPRYLFYERQNGRYLALPTDNTLAVKTLAYLPTLITTMTYVRKAGGNFIYYCRSAKLYRAQIAAENASVISGTELPLPSGVSCEDREINYTKGTMVYDSARSTAIIPVKQNGFYGIAEYYDP